MSLLNDLTAITTPALTDIVYCVQNSTDYKVTNAQLIALSKTNIIIPLTQAAYDALPSADKNNGALYVITDAVITAADIEYSSGVSVADKIDSLDFEEGTSGTLATGLRKYRKWADGTLEEWARQEKTETVTCTQWGGVYSWDASGIDGTSPIPFVSTDFVSGSIFISGLNGFGTLRPDTVNYIFVRGTTASGNYTVVRYRYQRGRWKA